MCALPLYPLSFILYPFPMPKAAPTQESPRQGHLVKRRRFAGFTLEKCTFAPGGIVAEPATARGHERESARLVCILRGSMRLGEAEGLANGEAPGQGHAAPCVLLLPHVGETQLVAGTRGASVLTVELDARWLERAGFAGLRHRIARRGGMAAHLMRLLLHEFHHTDEVSRPAIEGVLLGLLAELARRTAPAAEARAPEWLRQTRRQIELRFTEHLTLAMLATLAGVHPVHLAREFRRYFHSTIGETVRLLRVEFACRELGSSRSLAEIAHAAGFADQSHFCRCFKLHTGLTPAEYRLALAG